MHRDNPSKTQQQPKTPQTFTDGGPLPACLAFDLDYTLWPFWIDTHVDPPLRDPKVAIDRGRFALDAHGQELRFYRDVPRVLAGARAAGIKVAAASRTHAPELAQWLLRLLRIPAMVVEEEAAAAVEDAAGEVAGGPDLAQSYFDNLQIYPGNKLRHLQRISESLNIEYDEILFFDDEARNRNVEQLGVWFVDVPRGLDAALVDSAIEAWRKRRRAR